MLRINTTFVLISGQDDDDNGAANGSHAGDLDNDENGDYLTALMVMVVSFCHKYLAHVN